jgi:hypothetical protein
LAIFRRMRAEGVPQDHISYTSAITACEKVLKQAPSRSRPVPAVLERQ